MEQLGFDLGAETLPPQKPAFAGPAAFATALRDWQKGAGKATLPARAFAHPVETPMGTMVAVCDATHVHLLEFADRKELPAEMRKLVAQVGVIAPGQSRITRQLSDQLGAYFKGELTAFDLPLALHGTEFVQSVWQALVKVPYGTTKSYGVLSQDLGNPAATRAVARANGANQIAVVIPCHRIIGADGSLTGYAGGVWRKRALLELEARGGP